VYKGVIANVNLIVGLTCLSRTKVSYSDPLLLCGKVNAYRIKGTLGITG